MKTYKIKKDDLDLVIKLDEIFKEKGDIEFYKMALNNSRIIQRYSGLHWDYLISLIDVYLSLGLKEEEIYQQLKSLKIIIKEFEDEDNKDDKYNKDDKDNEKEED